MTAKNEAPPGRWPDGADIDNAVAAQFDGENTSSSNSLLQEFASAAAKAQEAATFDWLHKRLCIPRHVLAGPRSAVVGVQRVEVDGRHYQPHPEGRPAIVVPASLSYAPAELDPIDLVAWEPNDSARWMT